MSRLEIEETLTPAGAAATESPAHLLVGGAGGPGGRGACRGLRAGRAALAHAVVVAAGEIIPPPSGSLRRAAARRHPICRDGLSDTGDLTGRRAGGLHRDAGGPPNCFSFRHKGHEATPVPGSANAVRRFSPDSQWIAFFADGKLKTMPVGGGSPVNVCDAAIGFGGTWGADDTIVFAPAPGSPLWRVPSAAALLCGAETDGDRGEFSHRWPEFLPDGRTVLFTVGVQGSWDDAEIVAESIDTGRRERLVEGGAHPRYLASGHLCSCVMERRGSCHSMPNG